MILLANGGSRSSYGCSSTGRCCEESLNVPGREGCIVLEKFRHQFSQVYYIFPSEVTGVRLVGCSRGRVGCQSVM